MAALATRLGTPRLTSIRRTAVRATLTGLAAGWIRSVSESGVIESSVPRSSCGGV